MIQIRNATIYDIEDIAKLQGQMYTVEPRWRKIWEEGEKRFEEMWKSYLQHFPEGFFVCQDNELLGFIIVTKTDKVRAIPYVHDCTNYLSKTGKIASIEGFAINTAAKNKEEIAKMLYVTALNFAKKIKCEKIISVVGASILSKTEREIIKDLGFKIELMQQNWELFPNINTKIDIWSKEL